MSLRWEDEGRQPQDANLSWLMGRTGDRDQSRDVMAGGEGNWARVRVDEREGSATSQRGAAVNPQPGQLREVRRSLPLAGSLRPASSSTQPSLGDTAKAESFKAESFANAAAAGVDVPLPGDGGKDASLADRTRSGLLSDSVSQLSFDDGTRGPLPPGAIDDGTRGRPRPGVARNLSFDDGTRGPLPSSGGRNLRENISFDDGTRGPLPPSGGRDLQEKLSFDNATGGPLPGSGGRSLQENVSFDDGTRGALPPNGGRDLQENVSFDDGTRGPMPANGGRDLQENISFDDGTRGPVPYSNRQDLDQNPSFDDGMRGPLPSGDNRGPPKDNSLDNDARFPVPSAGVPSFDGDARQTQAAVPAQAAASSAQPYSGSYANADYSPQMGSGASSQVTSLVLILSLRFLWT